MSLSRRRFLQTSSGLVASSLACVGPVAKAAPSERVRVGVMGAGGRALSLITSFARNREVELGSQHRSTRRLQSAIEFVKSGKLGRCIVAKAWESMRQGSIGFPADEAVPAGVDYEMWQGPAPERPFNRNRFHGRWRWFYDYGTGDLGNDGVHRLDMAIALLNAACQAQGDDPVGLPSTVYASGGKWYFDDAQEFPDTLQANYEFGDQAARKLLTYEMRIWAPYPYLGHSEGSAVFGDQGYIVVGNDVEANSLRTRPKYRKPWVLPEV